MTPVQPLHPLVEQARRFAQEVLRPRAAEFDRSCAVPHEIIEAMAAQGFLGCVLPPQFGGAGIDMRSYGELTVEIGKGCSSTRALLTVHTSLVAETLLRLGSAEQKQRWLPRLARGERIACFALSEPLIGSDAASVRTRYSACDGGFMLSGTKKWITYAAVADLFLVIANGESGPAAFLVERGTAGLRTERITGLLASRGAHLAQITLEAVPVEANALLGPLGAGFSFVTNQALFHGRYSIAWAGVATAEAALEEMASYARSREQFGRKLRHHQLIKEMIADGVASVHAGRALCERVAALREAGDIEAVNEANIAKYVTSQLATRTAGDAVQLLGANGISEEYAAERLYREAKVLEIIEGSTQIQQLLIAEYGVRRYRLPTRR
ncbi:MAG: acyl-CoA dehydrogenase family protein [Betaproteobacteria bacterium]